MPYTHQQNGTAECSMCTILDAICSAMAKSRMPLKYWADAVSTVVYTQNLIHCLGSLVLSLLNSGLDDDRTFPTYDHLVLLLMPIYQVT